jgi:26S proteasome regulatory complex, subunit RPN10/PSMD4
MLPFLAPWYLLLLIGVAALGVVYAVLQLRRRRYVARFSNVELLGSVAPRRPGWRRHLTFALLMIALIVLSLGAARPSVAEQEPLNNATVMLDIDVSLSMEATDVLPSRIGAAKDAAEEFAKLLPPTINLGLLSFARSANVIVPPTLDRQQLVAGIESLQLANYTAIGEAIITSVEQIQAFGKSRTAPGQKPPPERIVLMSDGSNTYGRSLATAIAIARNAHISVSTIAFGTPNGTVVSDGQEVPVPADDQALSQIASETGGTFHTAHSEQELRSVYHDIGSQIGHKTVHKEVSWRYLLVGLLFLFAAGGTAMLWSGRLV